MKTTALILGLISFPLFAVTVKLTPVIQSGIQSPIYAAFEPGDSSALYVVEQKGRIKKYDIAAKQLTEFFNLEEKVTSGGEMGLLGLAFHPSFSTNGRFFVNYTAETPNLVSYVSEFKNGNTTEKKLMQYAQPFVNHNGGHVTFGPDGYLYIGTGDGGSAGDPYKNGQNKESLLGKILRIDVNTGSPYGIPNDNPFVSAKGLDEIYAYGLRNPWRFSFDSKLGTLIAGDVGQDKWEEINIVEKGKNYGWNTMEAKHCFSPAVDCKQTGLELPIWEYPHSQGVSITGGYVYRGTAIPELDGVYVYGDYGSGKIWGLYFDAATKTVTKNELLLNSRLPISSFGQDANGEIYVVSYTGAIYRLSK